MAKNFLILYNPASGRRRPELARSVARQLEERGQDVVLYPTTGPGDAREHLLAHDDSVDVIVAAGGDGTLHEVINGLEGKAHRPVGVIPSGTTNVFARELGVPRTSPAIVDMLLAGRTTSVYPNRVNGERFLLWVGAGFDAWVVAAVDLGLKKRIGKLAYALGALRSLPIYGRRRYRVVVDGQELDAYSLIVSSGRLYAGPFVLAPNADLGRPDLQVVLLRSSSRIVLALSLLALGLGRIARSRGVEIRTARKVEIERSTLGESPVEISVESSAEREEALQIDGDPAGTLPAKIEVEEAPLHFLVP